MIEAGITEIIRKNNHSIDRAAIQMGNRIIKFVEENPTITITVMALGILGSVERAAITAGWTPEQIANLNKSFPIHITIPTLSL